MTPRCSQFPCHEDLWENSQETAEIRSLGGVQPSKDDRICQSFNILRHTPPNGLGLALGAWIYLFVGLSPATAGTGLPPWRPHAVDPAAEIESTCRRISGKLASVGLEECLTSGLRSSGARSVEGTPILLRDFSPSAGPQPRGRILLFGGIHGDEYSSVSVVFKWLRRLERLDSGGFHWRMLTRVPPVFLRKRPVFRDVSARHAERRPIPTPLQQV